MMSEPTPDTPYQDLILSHAKAPQHYGANASAILRYKGVNPLCGDEVTVYLATAEPVWATFESQGCALCRASASILLLTLNGMPQAAASTIIRQFCDDFTNGIRQSVASSPELTALWDMRRFATRMSCVLLAWDALAALLAGEEQ